MYRDEAKKALPHVGYRYRCSLPGLAGFTGRRWQDHKLAERKGFEPPVPFGTHDFQSCTFDHSVTSPDGVRLPFRFSAYLGGQGLLRSSTCRSKNVAESKGFEPLVPLGTLDFESSTFDHSDSSPRRKLAKRLGVSTTGARLSLRSNCPKKLGQKCAALLAQDAGYTFEPMVESIVVADGVERLSRARFWIIAAPHDARDARVHESACAHRTRFERNVQSASMQDFAADVLGGCTDGKGLPAVSRQRLLSAR